MLKERDLDTRREHFDAHAWWRERVGIERPGDGETVVSLFAYENPAVDALLAQWRDGDAPVVLLVPEGRISGALARFFGLPKFAAGTTASAGALRAHALGFVEQPRFDELLWAADINFVRGEDSFVRAQWAHKPFVWQIYPQADDAHLPKLDAALAHYTGTLDPSAREAVARFWHAWNGAGVPDWADFWRHRQQAGDVRGALGEGTGGRRRSGGQSRRACGLASGPMSIALTAFPAAPCDWPNKQKVS